MSSPNPLSGVLLHIARLEFEPLGPCDEILLADVLRTIDAKQLEFKSHIDRVSTCIGQPLAKPYGRDEM